MRHFPTKTRSRALGATLIAALLLPAPLAAQRAQAAAVVRVEVIAGHLVLPDSVTARRMAVAVPVQLRTPSPDTTVAVLPDRRRLVQLVFVGN